MNPRSTWLLVLIALVLGAYAYLSGRRAPAAGATVDFAAFDPDSVQAIELLRSNTVIRVERSADGWKMALPVAYGAQGTAVDSFVKELAGLRPRTVIPPTARSNTEGTDSLKAFGLDADAVTVKLELREGPPLLYQFGGPTPLGSQFYFRRLGADGVFTADESFLAVVPPSADFWRDRGLFDLRGREFDRVEIRGPTPFTAERQPGGTWRLVKPLPARADGERIEALVQALQRARVDGFFSDSQLVDLEPLGLQPPEAELIIGRGANDLVRLQFGQVPADRPQSVFVRRLADTNLVLVPVEAAVLVKLPLANFRDRQLTPSLEGANELRFRSGDTTVWVERQGTNWTVIEPARFPADPGLMRQLLQQLGALQIVDFPNDVPADLARYGLDRPARSFTVLAGTNELVRLEFGAHLGLDRVYVRRADEPNVYATQLAELLRLPEVAGQLRDLRFAPTNVVEVTVAQQGRSRTLTRQPSGTWSVSAGAPGGLIDEAINETLYRLGQVASARFPMPGDRQLELLKFPEVDHTVTLKFRPKSEFETLAFQFGGRNPANNLLALVRFDRDEAPLLLEFPGTLYEDVFRDFSAP